jgi:hypothetical protein
MNNTPLTRVQRWTILISWVVFALAVLFCVPDWGRP